LNARQNPLTKFEEFVQGLIEGPFARLFPSRLEPVELMHKLERAMHDNTLLQGEGRRLAPNTYDIYLSIKDHQALAASQSMLIRDWQNELVEIARHRHYTLRTVPIIRLHADSSLHPGSVRVETSMGSDGQGAGDMHTQALSAEQLAALQAQLPKGQPGIVSGALPDRRGAPRGSNPNLPPVSTPMPSARLVIRMPQGGQQSYPIEKSIINIGRQLSNDIIVEDKRVSRYHAQIKYQVDGQFVIYDLGSTNGITINNTPHMRQHVLRNGDKFTIGSYDFHFERR
jgi:hypothetical protein